MLKINVRTISIILLLTIFPFFSPVKGQPDTLLLQSFEKKARASYGSSLDSSIYYAQQILDLDIDAQTNTYHAFALNWIGICLMRKGYPDSAELYYQETIVFGEEHNEKKYAQMAKLNRSINYHQQGLFEESALAAQESLEAFEKIGDSLGMAHAQYNLGNCLFQLHRPEEALTFYNSALKVYLKKEAILPISNTYNAIGSVFLANDQYKEALGQFRKSVDNKISVGGENFCASEYINMGTTYKELQKPDSAIFYYKLAYITAEKLGDSQKMANAYLDLATLFNEEMKPDSAKKYAATSEEISRSINDNFLIYNALYQLALANSKLGDFKQSYSQLYEYVSLKDSTENVEITEKIASLEKKFKVAEKDKQLLANEVQLAEKQNAIQRQMLIIALLVIIMIAILLWVRNRRKQQGLLYQIAMNKERNRIAMDLHDHVGAELTLVSSKLDTKGFKAVRDSEKEELEAISNQIRNVNNILKETVWSIREESIQISQLLDKVKDLVDKQFEGQDVAYSGTSNNNGFDLAPQVALTLYRVCQEGITNIFKHAEAQRVELSIDVENGSLEMVLSDDGKGFSAQTVKNGYGLQNMKQRIKQIGGNYSLKTQEQAGTSIHIVLPL